MGSTELGDVPVHRYDQDKTQAGNAGHTITTEAYHDETV